MNVLRWTWTCVFYQAVFFLQGFGTENKFLGDETVVMQLYPVDNGFRTYTEPPLISWNIEDDG